MAHHAIPELTDADTVVLGNRAGPWYHGLLALGGACLVLALILAVLFPDGVERFAFAYIVAYAFALAIVWGCLFFTIITTLFRAGWCAMVRRVAETFAACVPFMAALFIPVVVFVVSGTGIPYPWAQPFGDGAHAADVHDTEHDADHDDGEHHEGEDADETHDNEHARNADFDSPAGPARVIASEDADTHAEPGEHGEDANHAADADHGEEHADAHGGHHGPPTFMGENAKDWGWYGGALEYYVGVKYPWFEGWFWALRWIVYFAVFSLIGVGYWRLSVRQDRTKDPELTNTREKWAPASVITFALLTTFMTIDLLMSLDPVFFSTMFAIIFFANAFTAGLATMILVLTVLQRRGYLPNVTTEHYHDLGKLLFAFVFFWGYVSFSQFMLIWYASLPETTYWFELRGVTTAAGQLGGGGDTFKDAAAPTLGSGWSWVALFLLFFHLFLPFAILLSKHVKRHPFWRVVMSAWMLVVVYVDLYWYVMPVFSSPEIGLGFLPIDLLTAVGVVCLLLAYALRLAARHSLVAKGDPRLHESLALDTNVWAPIHAAGNGK